MTALLANHDDLRLFLHLEDIDEARADFILSAVTSEVRKFSDQQFERVTDEEVILDGSGTQVLLLPGLPVIEVLSVFEGGTELDSSSYEWSAKGILRKSSGYWIQKFRNVVVTYTHGIPEVTDDIRMFVCSIAARAFVNPTGVTNESEGGYSAGYGYDGSRLPRLTASDQDFLRAYMGR